MLQKKLGQRIAELRKTRHLTQVQLAKTVGCSVEFISLVERGVNAPSVARLENFAKALKVRVVALFTFDRQKLNQQTGDMNNDLIFYQFSRSKVERMDFPRSRLVMRQTGCPAVAACAR